MTEPERPKAHRDKIMGGPILQYRRADQYAPHAGSHRRRRSAIPQHLVDTDLTSDLLIFLTRQNSSPNLRSSRWRGGRLIMLHAVYRGQTIINLICR
ncbi:hypothetical protein BSZ35_18220 [Salinibacter sp. 10B]|nr:hypothetical protein BSZ35_18220 [Salinibacter sp. 10B]